MSQKPQLTIDQFRALSAPEKLNAVRDGSVTNLLNNPAAGRATSELFEGLTAQEILDASADPAFLAKAHELRLKALGVNTGEHTTPGVTLPVRVDLENPATFPGTEQK